ncbi:hypothetical protein [Streptomyces rubradiris]|uniref:Uncharacterized protein n=1 Tax=Streptomyces rubradiris TaxID=285531 RepID=A0ABQ3RCN1_STRRR|nr:hypothetical protein [Streptomyces rubradiris]GHG94000.1 hypothetical protein GCM10018792_03550 [Streptomyces rubradiris]GHI53616.1 hypothetical protein Srubr_34620 [Streptomyces rubradiris]
MTPHGTTSTFYALRHDWFDDLAAHLSGILRRISPTIHAAVPHDLGSHELLAATVLARAAQADMERREIAFVAGDLVRLAGPQGVQAPERVSEVEELWTALRHPTSPLLHSWWREPLGEGLLAHWARMRAEAVGWPQVHSELRERWSLDSDGIWRRGLGPADGSDDGDWCGYFAYLDAHSGSREAAFARVILERTPGLAEEIDAYASECADELTYVPHLALIHRERALAEALTIVIEGNLEAGGEVLPADLVASSRSLRDAGRAYLRWLDDEFVPRLTPLEHAHLDLGTEEAARAEAYLRQYAEIWCAPGDPALPTPVFTEEDYAPLKPAERPRALVPEWMAMVGQVFSEAGQLGWTGVVGSQPWWLYVAEAGMESAAALRFKHDGQVRIGHRTLDDPNDMLVGFPKHDPDAQSLHMRFRYDEDDAHEMCELLVLSRAGRAQLGFLIQDASGAYRMLRMVSVPIPPALRTAMRDKAVRRLDAMTGGEPGALGALIAPEPDGTPPSPSPTDNAAAGAPADADSHDGWEFADGTLFPREDTLF